MALAHRWTSRNLTRLELVFAITVIALLMGAFLQRGLRVFAIAEERSLQATVLNLNSALRILLYDLVISGRTAEVAQWQGANPVRLLESAGASPNLETMMAYPELARFHAVAAGLGARYQGEFVSPDAALVEDGKWYFDMADSVLVYRVRNHEFFRSALPGPPQIRFRLEVRFDDLNGDGQYNPELEPATDVTLRTVDEYRWTQAGVNL
ncbi:MAG: hypothetical protein HYR49_07210 [Gammaproteobacteria bacterium]|nr:hypothetical protein [Gammaproteobacteria bacterium]